MDKIYINHAYDGFLYAPLFLAYRLGLFPNNCELKLRGGDSEAIRALCDHPQQGEKNWFAICDPFSVEASVPPGTGERLCVVGTIIERAPVWLYNTNSSIDRLSSEDDLHSLNGKINQISTYPEDTTGCLFGKRIQEKYLRQVNGVTTHDFGQEFKDADSQTLVVTSDVLRVVKEENDSRGGTPHIIFSYAENGPSDTKPYLFTAIITLRETVLKQNLSILLAVMSAINKAIDYLQAPTIEEKHITLLTFHFRNKLRVIGVRGVNVMKQHVRDCIEHLREQQLYSKILVPEETSLTNAKLLWDKIYGSNRSSPADCVQKVPSILLWPTRFSDFPHLQKAVIERTDRKTLWEQKNVQELFSAMLSDPEKSIEIIDKIPEEKLFHHTKVIALVENAKTAIPISAQTRFEGWQLVAFALLPILSFFLTKAVFEAWSDNSSWEGKVLAGKIVCLICVPGMWGIFFFQWQFLQRQEFKAFNIAMGIWLVSVVGVLVSAMGLL
jgi:hypothetical protein